MTNVFLILPPSKTGSDSRGLSELWEAGPIPFSFPYIPHPFHLLNYCSRPSLASRRSVTTYWLFLPLSLPFTPFSFFGFPFPLFLNLPFPSLLPISYPFITSLHLTLLLLSISLSSCRLSFPHVPYLPWPILLSLTSRFLTSPFFTFLLYH